MPALHRHSWTRSILLTLAVTGLLAVSWAGVAEPAKQGVTKKVTPAPDAREVAREADRLILEELTKAGIAPAPPTRDEDFLRRVSLDLTGTIPSASEVTLFALDPDPDKRAKLVDRLLESDAFADNWARYWRDVIYMRATEQRSRLSQGSFETWMATQIKGKTAWDKIATSLLTATGDVLDNGATALMFAHGGEADEIAAETSRIFLGIQIQCANCHDHPTDKWKRKDFHELAAFFPRVSIRRKYNAAEMEAMESMKAEMATQGKPGTKKGNKKGDKKSQKSAVKSETLAAKKRLQGPPSFEVVSFVPRGNNLREQFFLSPERAIQRLDKDGDRQLSRNELERTPASRIFDRLLAQADENKENEKLSASEIKNVRPPENPGRGSAEYHMPDLNDPASPGKEIAPSFFLTDASPKKGLDDIERRSMLARYVTAPKNVWFARAYVNRMWGELFGAGFYTPVDDIGPERSASFPQVLDLLCKGFVDSGYDMRWLFRAMTSTAAYQRQVRPDSPSSSGNLAFASAVPKRLRADQLYDSIVKIAGAESLPASPRARGDRRQGILRSPRGQFGQIFGFDPSTPQEDLVGTVPQALFFMNSPALNRLVEARGGSKLRAILDENDDDADAVNELYLLVLGRNATETEVKTCVDYRKEVGSRSEAFEDVFWSLLNSSEFLSQR